MRYQAALRSDESAILSSNDAAGQSNRANGRRRDGIPYRR
ncbi:phosphohistidine phosphatase SixA [Burkholderia multivorans CGD2M]|uniref:Phosphohistidine phosphatase SixA n=1 Tax=Burkholderia multivorans CGD2 TaxID=513052 RepID=B9BND8_9BURK|nr:phosphohistidine phosphatase SixA [Burkholderia multivorans CGD1]EEE08148.1 phosphohistidine phosphatase SixA [Burkholderia multivorans CGD2]EEE10503.1 phosphohistidine phosphatase SixA [Burkholderia multivorans CGD2M]